MGTVVDATIPSDQFVLTETFDVVSDVVFEAVQVAAHGPREVMPYLWASTSEQDRLDGALREDGSTAGVTRLSRDDDRTLYHIDWRPGIREVVGIFLEANGSLLGAHGESGRWDLRLLFPDRESVSTTYDNWRSYGIDPSIRRVNGVSDLDDPGGMGLSPYQQKALVEAFQTDYYDIPRGITLDNLATNFDVSHQALSERLRRGHRNLIATTLCQSPSSVRHRP